MKSDASIAAAMIVPAFEAGAVVPEQPCTDGTSRRLVERRPITMHRSRSWAPEYSSRVVWIADLLPNEMKAPHRGHDLSRHGRDEKNLGWDEQV